jgi:H+-transporting ATPase
MTISEQSNNKDESKGSSSDSDSGLSSADVKERLEKFGYNEVLEKKKSRIRRFAKKFWGITPVMLELTILLTWILGNNMDSTIILALLIFNALVSYFQEEKANASLNLLRNRLKVIVRVKRDNAWTSVPARELVPGDVIRLRSGDFVPADMVIKDGSVEADQSSLTGESISVERGMEGLVYSGSIIRRGEATGKVSETGARTYFGRTVELVQIARPRLHMEDVVSNLVKWLITVVGLLVTASLIIGLLRGQELLDIVPLATILLVAAIPIALPTMFNITMALGSHELANKGIIVTRLSASEDAATMDVLCVDKTGTLTENKLSLAAVVPFDGHDESEVLKMGALASQVANGDPIDLAILSAVKEKGLSVQGYVQEKFVPFSPTTRRTEAEIRHGGDGFNVVKGALGSVLPLTQGTEESQKGRRTVGDPLCERLPDIGRGLRQIGEAGTHWFDRSE